MFALERRKALEGTRRIHAGSTGDSVDGRRQRRHWVAPCRIGCTMQQRYAAAAGSTSNINKLSSYFKHGQTLEGTCGHYSGITQVNFKDCLRLQDNQPRDMVMWDHCIVGLNNIPFVAGGDSGSFVFDTEGQFVGMLMGADGRANTATVLSAEALVKDILDTISARDVRLTGTQPSV